MVRQDFDCCLGDMPPKSFMMQVMDEKAKAYCFLWEKKDANNRVCFTWKDLSKYYHRNSFKTNLRKLNKEGLLSFDESSEGIVIELVGWDEIIND